jgi:hypothetical protein
VPVAHTCNSTYSGGRDQEDGDSRPAQANSLRDPIYKKKKITKKWLESWLKVHTEFKSQYQKKKKKKGRKGSIKTVALVSPQA